MQFSPQLLPVLSALKVLTASVDTLASKVEDMQTQINAMEEEWRNEYEVDYDDDEETDDEETDSASSEEDSDSEQSVQSAPATFSYKRQRTD